MSRLQSTDLDLIRGDDFTKRLTFADADGVAIDLSGWVFTGQVRTEADAADPVLASFSFDTTDAATGVVDASLAAADTATFSGRFVVYDIQAVNTAGKTRTYLFGRLNILKDVTR